MSTLRFIRSSRGFTLIETMIIVAIIGVLAGLTIPAFANYIQRQKVIGARNELMADIQYARSLAIARRTTYQIDFEAGQYRLIIPGPDTVIRTKTAPDGVTFNADTDPNFYAWGLSDACNIAVSNFKRTSNVSLLPNGTVTYD
jgi:prepilin-type N-terminal cleavage/methylation domain-containing protein